MNKEKQNIVPELRFPEFENDGDWNNTELGKCLLKHPEYGIGAAAVPYSEKLPTYLRITDISVDGKFIKDDKVSVSKKVTEDNYLKEGDIVFARTGASVGKSYKYRVEDGRLVFAGFLIRVKPNTNKLNSELLFQFVATEHYWSWVKFVSARSGQPGINGKQYASMPILLPPKKEEQQKIANCLSSLDKVITAETEKLDLLQDHKKGLLQQLFPQEGERQPQYRFPEFKKDGDWKQDDLGKSLKAESSQIAKSRLNFKDEGFPVYGADGFNGFIENYSQEKDYVAIVKDGSGVGNLYYCEGKSSVLGTLNYLLSKNEEKYKIKWLYYLLNTINFKPFIKGANIPHIYFKDYSKLLVFYPKNPKEQQKIATCLTAADELIEAQDQKIENLKEHKKGLMQQLFPSENELAV